MKTRQKKQLVATAATAALTVGLVAFHGTILALFTMMLLRFITGQF